MSSKESSSWLGDPDVCLMSEDGHKVMTHRAVLGLYSISFRHLLSINPADGEVCMIICHDMNYMQIEELVEIANLNFQKLSLGEYQKDILGNQKESRTIPHETKQLSQEETLTESGKSQIYEPPSIDNLESSIDLTSEDLKADIENTTHGEMTSLTPRNQGFNADIENITRVEKTSLPPRNQGLKADTENTTDGEKTSLPPRNQGFKADLENSTNGEKTSLMTRNPKKWVNIEEVNNCIDKTSEEFKNFKSLDKYREFNPETKRIDCKLCDKTYGRAKKSYRHIRCHIDSVHMEKYLSCRFCRKEFFSVVSFMHHYKSHINREKYRCDECGVTTNGPTGLSKHICGVSASSTKNFKCNLCDSSFSQKAAIVAHNQSKHGGGKKFPCPYCNHSSITEVSLKVHIKLKHENVQSFKCKDCDYVCKRSDYLTRHVRSIHENVRFQCHQCEYQATRKQYLESHIKKIHNNPDFKMENLC